MKKYMRILIVITLLVMGSNGAWADTDLQLKNNLGANATVTFYTSDGEPTVAFINDHGDAATTVAAGKYVVMHIVPKNGYWTNEKHWTNEKLLFSYETKASLARTRAPGLELGQTLTLLKADEGRNDGAGWYYYQVPAAHDGYTNTVLDGYVVPKFNLNNAEVGTDGVTYTIAEGQWSTTLTIDNSKTSFEYNGKPQGPTKLTKIVVKHGEDVAVTINGADEVAKHVTAAVNAKEGSSLNAGKAIDAGSYALNIKAAVTDGAVAVDGASTRAPSTTTVESGIFTKSKDVDFTIAQKKVEIVPKVENKEYDGKTDAKIASATIATGIVGETLNYVSGLTAEFEDANVGTGKWVYVTGTYKVEKGNNQTKVANYTFSVAEDVKANITAKALAITADAQEKVCGEADPPLTYTKEGLLEGDAISGALARAEGEDVGEYAITQGTLSAGNNYTITFTGAKLTIKAVDFAEGDVTAKGYTGTYDGKAHTITVTAPKSATIEYGKEKDTYGLTEAPTYTDADEYTVYFKVTMANTNPVTGSQTVKINKKAITITADAQTKVAGEKDPELTYQADGLVEGDEISGALARDKGEDVGEYAITQGTLSAGDNYTISFTGAKLTITSADFAEGDVTAKGYTGTYDGKAHTIEVTAPKSATIEYGTEKDTYGLTEAPTYTDAGEYTVYFKVTMDNTNPVTGSQTVKINKKALTITADAQTKVAGEKDPELTYQADGLVEGDKLTGALARAAGEDVGEYAITQGTLSAGDNYTITFTGAKLTIKEKTPDPILPIKKSFKVVVAESEGGSVSVSKIEASPGTQINMKINPVTGYHLETITIKKSHGGEVQHDITFDAKDESWDYFLMPSDDVIITAVFEKDKDAQNIFIYKSYYGEVVANTISADENEPVNLVAHPAYDNCVLDELVVINDEGKQLDLTTSYDSKEGKIYTFMMAGNWVQVFSTFRGTNDVVDGARPFGLDKRFYQLSLKNQNILQTTAETKDVQIAMSLNANIFCQVADDGSLMMKQGEDVGLMIGGLKKGNFFRIDHDGEIVLEIPDIIKAINDAFQQPAHILTRGEDTAIIKPGVAYEVVEDVNLELVLKGSAPLVLKSIIVEGPEPTAINRLQADDEAADIYDLSGRKVDPTSLRKGLYIRNGKKIVIK